MKMPENAKIISIPISQLGPDYEKSLEFAEASVAYFDVMGFKTKNNKEEIEWTLADFSGALITPARTYEAIRFKIFSDCAFLAAPIEKITELISAIRYSFERWTFDGIFVRGGIALGSYTEYRSH